jgi:hypothetical protein
MRRILGQPISLHEDSFEYQGSDPDIVSQRLSWDARALAFDTAKTKALGIKKDSKTFALTMLNIASRYADENGQPTPELIEAFLSLFTTETRENDGKLKAFCAAGISYCATRAYCDISPNIRSYKDNAQDVLHDTLPDISKFYFRPHCACLKIIEDAQNRRVWEISPANPMPGWLVFFGWRLIDKKTQTRYFQRHTGIVEGFADGAIHTIEFNTSNGLHGDQAHGGLIARRKRTYDGSVLGFVKTYS